ncbi:MAG: hypothetical protein V4568_14180 [Pseudomonadota bacterium]
MKSSALEVFLARLYTDETTLQHFLENPHKHAMQTGLDEADIAALMHIDRVGLRMAATSYALKREQHKRPRYPIRQLLVNWLKALSKRN